MCSITDLTEVGTWRERSHLGFGRSGYYDGIPHGGYYTADQLHRRPATPPTGYTADQLRGLVRCAAARGVTAVPEVDWTSRVLEIGTRPDGPGPASRLGIHFAEFAHSIYRGDRYLITSRLRFDAASG